VDILTRRLAPLPGLSVGHWTDAEARTGCTVIRFDAPALTAVDVRGSAPGSRELDLLGHGRSVQRPDAILLTGGSAFGLGAADGVVSWLAERGRGYPTSGGPVPIVPAAVIFDLATGPRAWPGPDAGYAATDAAGPLDRLETGSVGAGTGATIGAVIGRGGTRPGGCVAAQIRIDEGTVFAFAVVNAFGTLTSSDDPDPRAALLSATPGRLPFGEATTLLSCVTDIPLDHDTLQRMTVAMHDGLARSIVPVHTMVDGDVAFASTLEAAPAPPPERAMRACMAAEMAIETAIGRLHEDTRTSPAV
jgi:L-aminopeptidase/D-esterase-like protein